MAKRHIPTEQVLTRQVSTFSKELENILVEPELVAVLYNYYFDINIQNKIYIKSKKYVNFETKVHNITYFKVGCNFDKIIIGLPSRYPYPTLLYIHCGYDTSMSLHIYNSDNKKQIIDDIIVEIL